MSKHGTHVALASATAGRPHVFECPTRQGWNVWAPDIELAH
ncbi:MAG: hypothetical protein ACRDQ5_25530 [Sciscionella sp.]